ncbi:MAG: hypothetical protein ACFCUG_05085 [Thiotrichales bacterium]
MPYYVFKIDAGPTSLVKNLELLQSFEKYPEARDFARAQRAAIGAPGDAGIKMVMANDLLEAEESLNTSREAPILQEWEK